MYCKFFLLPWNIKFVFGVLEWKMFASFWNYGVHCWSLWLFLVSLYDTWKKENIRIHGDYSRYTFRLSQSKTAHKMFSFQEASLQPAIFQVLPLFYPCSKKPWVIDSFVMLVYIHVKLSRGNLAIKYATSVKNFWYIFIFLFVHQRSRLWINILQMI